MSPGPSLVYNSGKTIIFTQDDTTPVFPTLINAPKLPDGSELDLTKLPDGYTCTISFQDNSLTDSLTNTPKLETTQNNCGVFLPSSPSLYHSIYKPITITVLLTDKLGNIASGTAQVEIHPARYGIFRQLIAPVSGDSFETIYIIEKPTTDPTTNITSRQAHYCRIERTGTFQESNTNIAEVISDGASSGTGTTTFDYTYSSGTGTFNFDYNSVLANLWEGNNSGLANINIDTVFCGFGAPTCTVTPNAWYKNYIAPNATNNWITQNLSSLPYDDVTASVPGYTRIYRDGSHSLLAPKDGNITTMNDEQVIEYLNGPCQWHLQDGGPN